MDLKNYRSEIKETYRYEVQNEMTAEGLYPAETRKAKPARGDSEGSGIKEIGAISNRILTADEMGQIKRGH